MRRVRADTRQREEPLDRSGHAPQLDDGASELTERLGPPHEPERADHAPDGCHASAREGLRVGPALEQPFVHARHGPAPGTLKQHLRDEDPEGVRLGAPGEPTAIGPAPAQELPLEEPRIPDLVHREARYAPVCDVGHRPQWTGCGRMLHMDVLVTITILDDEGEEIDTVSASAETPEEAFQLALEQIDLEPGP